ncbi:MAG: Flp pilus assembly protein CpaB [Alphaproteobacteria bacterium]|nr:Flp pilus assembly protein CpaB [Alphaproteobacteria bacterium]MBO6861026.1 Flp pilus assembly protein CpaB [Alphaproteobacteria bacterium]MEC9267253.1 Flp pilus assembly protein CpaB [Pseudomonadota bacterium]
MRIKLLLLLLVAGGAAFGAVTVARGWLEDRRAELLALQASEPVQVETIDTVEVLVAKEDLPSGTFLNLDQFVWTPFPSSNLPETYLTRATLGEEGLTGAVIRGAITSGEPLTSGRVIRPGDRGFLAAVLRPGLRAVSVPVDATTGIAGFVFPGDRVDLLLTHEIELSQRVKRLATETVLTDIRVLAVDQRTDDTEGEPTLAKTATLEVDSKSAEVIAVALRMGRLSLALRSLAQYPDALATATPSDPQQTYTWDSQASRLLPPIAAPAQPERGAPAKPAPPKVTVTVFRRGQAETVEFRDTGS